MKRYNIIQWFSGNYIREDVNSGYYQRCPSSSGFHPFSPVYLGQPKFWVNAHPPHWTTMNFFPPLLLWLSRGNFTLIIHHSTVHSCVCARATILVEMRTFSNHAGVKDVHHAWAPNGALPLVKQTTLCGSNVLGHGTDASFFFNMD